MTTKALSMPLSAAILFAVSALSRAQPPAEDPAAPDDAAPPNAVPSDAPPSASPVTELGPATQPPEPEEEQSSTTPDPQISAQELAELERALQADASAANEAGATSSPAAPSVANSSLRSPDIALIADLALAAFSSDDPLQSGAHDPRRNGFSLQQLEMSMQAPVDPYFRLDAFVVFSELGVEVEEVYATTLALPGSLQARIGKIATRFGRLNASHPHGWDFVDQTFVLGRVFGGEGNRALGVEGSWLTPLPWYVELVLSATHAAGEATARSFYGGDDLGVKSPLDLQSTLAVKQFFPLSDDWSLAWGLAYAGGPNPTGRDNRSELYGTDLYLKYRPITAASYVSLGLQTEWIYRRRQVPGDSLQDLGGYAQAVLRFARRWATAARYEYGSPAWDSAGQRVVDPLDPEWTASRHRLTQSLTFFPTEFSRLRLQGALDLPHFRPEPDWAAILACELAIGAHGAHAF